MLLEIRDQLLHDRVAVGAVIGRVHGVGVVEVRGGMLNVTAIICGNPAERQARENSNPGSRSVRARRAARCSGVSATLSVEKPNGGLRLRWPCWYTVG